MPTYDNSIPNAGHVLSIDQPKMLHNFEYLQTSIGTDHFFSTDTGTPEDGFHEVIHFVPNMGDPANSTVGQLYTKTMSTGDELFFKSGNSSGTLGKFITQLTGGDNVGGTIFGNLLATQGYVWLPGPFLFQWSGLINIGNTFNYTFGVAPLASLIPFPSLNPFGAWGNMASATGSISLSVSQTGTAGKGVAGTGYLFFIGN